MVRQPIMNTWEKRAHGVRGALKNGLPIRLKVNTSMPVIDVVVELFFFAGLALFVVASFVAGVALASG